MFSRPYLRELGLSLLLYVALVGASVSTLVTRQLSPAPRALVASLPMLGCAGMVWAVLRELRRLDELQRRIQHEALMFSFTGTALITLSWGFLEVAGLPRVSAFVVWPLMGALWAIGQALAKRRYR